MIYFSEKFWALICLLPQCLGEQLHPTSCTEDSQCSTGFYCEPGVHLCRQCLSCDLLQREAPPADNHDCIKSVGECGDCFDGLIQEFEGLVDGPCSEPKDNTPHGVLPPYAWAAIAASLLLMTFMMCVFVRLKTFKITYASSMPVHSLRPVANAPPPYNDFDSASAPNSSMHGAIEMHRLIGPPSNAPSPESDGTRPRVYSSNQTARVSSSPAYMRIPLNPPSCQTADVTASVPEGSQSTTVEPSIPIADEHRLTSIHEEDGDNNAPENNLNLSNGSSNSTVLGVHTLLSDKNTIGQEASGDSNNNNCSDPNEQGSSQRRSPSAQYCNSFVAGPSFVINVVENIQTNQQRIDNCANLVP